MRVYSIPLLNDQSNISHSALALASATESWNPLAGQDLSLAMAIWHWQRPAVVLQF